MPIVFTPKLITESPRQMWAHLLCLACEGLLKTKGEDPILGLVNRAGTFPLLNSMNRATPCGSSGDVPYYSSASLGVDNEGLAYFALSLLWRGSLKNWGTLKGQTTSISLGSHQESMRAFLAGETGFPPCVIVNITACTDLGSRATIFAPWTIDIEGGQYAHFEILIRGIWFRVLIGAHTPIEFRNFCCVNSDEKVVFKRDCNSEFLDAGRHFYEEAEVSEGLTRGRK